MSDAIAILPNELTLVTRASADPAAFAEVYDHYFPRVYNYIRLRIQDSVATDDVTAQVFERALVHIKRYRPARAPFAAWLFAIARNVVNDHLRAQRRHRWISLDMLQNQPSPAPQPDEVAERNETRTELLAAVARLSRRERDLIALKYGAGLANRRIARLTGLSEGNVGVIVYRAIRRLRAELGDKEQDNE